jgi:hypothetical protein
MSTRHMELHLIPGEPLVEQLNLGVALIGLFAGLPLGYLIYAIVDLVWRAFGGAGRFVNRKRLRSGLLAICNQLLEREERSTLENKIKETIRQIGARLRDEQLE